MSIGTKPRFVVLKGGPSDESSLSMQHGNEVSAVLRSGSDYDVVDVFITKKGEWLEQGMVRNPQAILEHVDAAYIALHGIYGEDGTIQRVLERYAVPYIGSSPYQSACSLNKLLAKEAVNDSGVLLAPHMRVTREGTSDPALISQTIASLFGPAYMLKPMSGGSSIGNRYAESSLQLAQTLSSMFKDYDDILVEQYIEGIDATCGIVDGLRSQKFYPTAVVEIIPNEKTDVFTAEKIAPGRFSKTAKEAVVETTKRVHAALELQDISRSDFRITPSGKIYFLEVNTLPATTKNSPLLAGLEPFGVTQEELVCHLCGTII